MSLYPLLVPTLRSLELDPRELQIVETKTLLQRHHPNLSVDRPALIGPLGSREHYAALSALLCRSYPPDHPLSLVCHVAGQAPTRRETTLGKLEQAAADGGTVLLYLPPLPETGAIESFQNTVAHLRAPGGCPWDRKQTHRSLRQSLQEEAYEVLDALDRDNIDDLVEELGDLLLVVLMQVQIGSELGEFRMSDVIHHVNAKIVRRHPHVFGDLIVDGVDEVLYNWEEIKQKEAKNAARASALESVVEALPALTRTQSLLRHAHKVQNEIELEQRIGRTASTWSDLLNSPSPQERQTLLGDLLFDLAALAQEWKLDAESALREANNRFEQRFREWEAANV